MDSLTVRPVANLLWSIIVPCRDVEPEPEVIEALQSCGLDWAEAELLVCQGVNPSRQRNEAVANATGKIIVFLDSDCLPTPDYFKTLLGHFKKTDVDLIGGPLVLPPESTALERLFQGLLGHPLLTGPVACRYAPLGRLRRSSEAELILANLAVRRSVWEKHEGFQPTLYPNEENEWMDRLAAAGVGVWYDPLLAVARPQRTQWRDFFRMLLRYGQGRTRQSLLARRFNPLRHLPALALLFFVVMLATQFVGSLVLGAMMGMLYAAAVFYAHPVESPAPAWQIALCWPLVPLGYALGQWWGLFQGQENDLETPVQVYRAERE
jgi:hypothetical protein